MPIRQDVLITFLLALFVGFIPASFAAEVRHVLLLNSYHAGMDWTDGETAGIREVLQRDGPPVVLHVEYMDTKRLADDTHFENLRQLFAYKYRNISLAAILATDNDAFEFLRQRRDSLFGQIPVIFSGVNFFHEGMLEGLHGYTGVAETFDGIQSIGVMQRLHPDARRIVVVIDGTTTGKAIRKELEPMLIPFMGKLAFEFWDNLTIDQLKARLPKLDKSTLVLLMPFARDSANTYVAYPEMAEMVSRYAPVPVYGTWDFYMGYGIVGGRLTNAAAQGHAAATMLLRVLHGTDINTIPVTRVAPSEFQFDARQLDRYDISRSALPAGSRILFQSWYENNRNWVWTFAGLVAISLLLVWTGLRSQLQRRQSERALQESEENYRELVENVNAIVLRLAPDGTVTYFNDFAERFFGYPAREILGQHVVGTIVPAEESGTGRDLSALISSILADPARYEDNENENMVRDGRRVFIRWANRVIQDSDGRPSGVLCIGRDVTELKKKEDALRESEERYRTLYIDTPAVMHSINADGTIVSVSNLWLQTLGYCREEVIGRKSTDFLTEESRRLAVEKYLPEFFRSGALIDAPYQIVAKDGRILDVLLSASSVRDAEGHIVRSLAVMTDVTERNKAEKSLREAINYVENLLRTANVIIVELGLDGSVIRLNSAAEAVTGYRFEELRGRNWFEVVVPKDHYPDVWQEFEHITTTRGLPAEFENPILTRTGEVRHIVWRNSMIIRDEQVAGTLSFGIDLTEKKNMQDRLNQSESLLREAQSLAHIGHWTYDYQTHEWIWSDELFRILGLDPSQTHPSLKAFLDVVHEEDRVRVNDTYQQFLNSCQSDELDFQLLMHDGNNKFVKQRFEAVLDNEGTPSRLFGILQDETLEILQELGLKESEERFRTVANYTYDWEYWEGPRKEMLFTSPSCERITGYVPVDFVCDPELLQKIVHPEDRAAWEAHQCGIHEDDYGELSFRIVRKDGEIRWIAHGCQGVYARNGQFRGRRSSNRDITDLKQAEQLAHQLAYFDSLTNLPNRRMLMDRMGNALAQAKRSHRSMAVMFLDLDHFKQINDTLGHTIGDKLLIAVADRLTTCVRQGDTVSRTGGDEFIVLLPELAHPGDARTVAEKFIQVLSSPIEIQGNVIETSISIGISIHPADGTGDSEELMTKADSAMYEAKRAGRNCYLVSDP